MNVAVLLLVMAPAADPETIDAKARAFVTQLEKGEFDAAVKNFDDTMTKLVTPDKLKGMWDTLAKQAGPFQKQDATRQESAGGYESVFVTCKFEKAALDIRVVFNKDKKISGLNVAPAKTADSPGPPYAKNDAFVESPVKVGSGEWELPGTLTLPKGAGPFPAVVLVHGSGPQDRDETMGALKPFRDLAWGLATKGIAVLRYEKRTREYGLKTLGEKNFTVKEETTDDALLAAALLRKTDKIDPKRVYIVGHSQGAMMAPKMALVDKALAGIVLLAGPSRLLEDVTLEQTKRGLANKEALGQTDRMILETLQGIATKVKEGKLTPDTPRSELMGMTGTYWLSLLGYRPPTDAVKLTIPILILQGEADDQVTMADFDGWKQAMAGRKNATLKSYPNLGHPFTTRTDITKPAFVSEDVVNDIAAWIGKK